MKLSKFLCAGTWLAFSFIALAQTKPDTQKTQRPIVILVTIDGFPARALNADLPMPTLLGLARSGAVADGMIPVNPTVTWPNHTTLITGVDASRHHVLANGLMELSEDSAMAVRPEADKSILVHGQTLYDVAAEHGLVTGQTDWVAVAGAKNITWQFPEKPTMDSPIVQEMIHDGQLTEDDIRSFGKKSPAWHDQVWTDAAIHILRRHTPDLLLVHLLDTDTLQHRYGPLTPAAYAAYGYADFCLSRIVAAVKEAGLSDRVTYIVASDHGFSAYHRLVRPGAYLRQLKLGDNWWVKAEGGSAYVFLRGKDREGRAAAIKRQLEAMPGVDHVYTSHEAQRFGLPSTEATDQAPDLWITAAPDYAFEDGADGDVVHTVPLSGQHGYPNTSSEMQALFIASGAAIKPGVRIPVFENLQVAPTIARILGIALPDATSAPLSQILR